jgi:hypothetical protein
MSLGLIAGGVHAEDKFFFGSRTSHQLHVIANRFGVTEPLSKFVDLFRIQA